jgi:hypothetical protein
MKLSKRRQLNFVSNCDALQCWLSDLRLLMEQLMFWSSNSNFISGANPEKLSTPQDKFIKLAKRMLEIFNNENLFKKQKKIVTLF